MNKILFERDILKILDKYKIIIFKENTSRNIPITKIKIELDGENQPYIEVHYNHQNNWYNKFKNEFEKVVRRFKC